MNIFWLDSNPTQAASYQCDKHVVKMILESAQMLSAAHHFYGTQDDKLYKLTHKNHPCTKWVCESAANYVWLYHHFIALCDEYTHRYGKIHKTRSKLEEILRKLPSDIPDVGLTKPAQAMPDEYKNETDTVLAYRQYYTSKMKTIDMRWKLDNMPDWLNVETNLFEKLILKLFCTHMSITQTKTGQMCKCCGKEWNFKK